MKKRSLCIATLPPLAALILGSCRNSVNPLNRPDRGEREIFTDSSPRRGSLLYPYGYPRRRCQDYKNITRLTYMPNYEADSGWADGYPANRNGVIQDFEIYVTDYRLQEGEYAPPSALAGYGTWETPAASHGAGGPGGASSTTYDYTAYKVATFSGVTGRYVQFVAKSSYHDTWSTGGRMIANGKEIKIYTADRAYKVEKTALGKNTFKAEALENAYPEQYGYTYAMLENWLAKARGFRASAPTQEVVDEMTLRNR